MVSAGNRESQMVKDFAKATFRLLRCKGASSILTLCAAAFVSLTVAAGASDTPAKRETIRLISHTSLLPLYAKSKPELFADVLAKEGIDIQWVEVQGSHAPAIAAVIGGSADVTFGGTTAVALTSAANGQDIVIAALAKGVKTNGGIVVYPDSGIKSVADLRGKTVAVNRGGFGELTLVSALEKNNIPRDAVQFVFLSIPDGAAAFAAKQVDAYVSLSSGTQTVTVDYGAKLIFDVDKDLTSDESVIAGNTLAYVTTRKFAAEHKDALRKIFERYIAVSQWVRENLGEAFEINDKLNRYPKSIREEVRAQFLGDIFLFPASETDITQLQQSAEFLLKNKVLPRAIDVRKYVVNY
jgi:sulfonate transport system substrate-binding protein